MKKFWYEDFNPGREFALGPKRVDAGEVIEFAREFDAQPMHLSEEGGRASILGGLSASGWHTCAMMMRMLCESYVLESSSQGAPGIDFLEWRKPVLAGDTLSGKSIVLETRPMRSRPGIGVVRFRNELYNQKGELVLAGENAIMMALREPVEASA